jgi:hypothetical protein
MNYEIHIGEEMFLVNGSIHKKPKQTIIITEDQFQVIKEFASTKKDKDLNTIYILNDVEFKVVPRFELDEN